MIVQDYAYDKTDKKPQFKQGPRSQNTSTLHFAVRLKLYNKAWEKGEPFTL